MHESGDSPEGAIDAEERIEIEFVDDEEDDAESPPVEVSTGGPEPPGGELERLKQEHEELRDMYLRKLAEFDNYRKRTDRERDEQQKLAAEGLIRELLPVVDNFERALQHANNSDPAAFRTGVEMISRQLWELLQRTGVQVIDPKGEPFNPELHDAVQRIEGPEHAPGRVVTVHAKGYVYSGRLLRPAMVAVAVERHGDDGGEGGAGS